MNWFLIALINPVAHAFANHLDKYILSRFMKGGSAGSFILFMALFSVIALPVILILNPGVFSSITAFRALVLMINGGFLVAAILFYVYALNLDEASFVAPFFQLVPVFGFILGYMVLGEVLRSSEILGALFIIVGGVLLSLELTGGQKKLKTKLLLLMVGSSFFYALNGVVFKSIAVHQGFMDSLFWDMSGKFLFGVLLFLGVRSYRTQFLEVIRINRFSVIGLSLLTEVVSLIGEIALVFAVLLAPVALVQSVGGLQPLFVFLLGLVITLLFPGLGQESLQPKIIAQKIIGIGVITAGVYFLGII